MTKLLTDKIRDNDSNCFKTFSSVRKILEEYLIQNKQLITQMFANVNREARVTKARDMLNALVNKLSEQHRFTTDDLLDSVGFAGQILDAKGTVTPKISDDVKSAVLLRTSLSQALKCPICGGLLHASKSASYDHKVRVRDGGRADMDNIQITHPYCNSAVKN